MAKRVMSASCVLAFALVPAIHLAGQVSPTRASAKQTNINAAPELGRVQTFFEVRFQAFENVYLNIEPGNPLVRGMKLLVRHPARSHASGGEVIGELQVKSVSDTSAICEVLQGDAEKGDIAYLTDEEIAALTKRQPQIAATSQPSSAPTQVATDNRAPQTTVPAPVAAPKPAAAPVATTVVMQPSVVAKAQGDKAPQMALAPATPGAQTVAVAQTSATPTVRAAVATQKVEQPKVVVQANIPAMKPPAVPTPVATNVQPVISVVASHPAADAKLANSTTQALPPEISRQTQAQLATAPATAAQTPVAPSVPATPAKTEVAQASTSDTRNVQPQSTGVQTNSGNPDVAQVGDSSLPDIQTIFKIKFVAQDTVYLSAGTATGLTAGMKLTVKHSEADITNKGTLAKASQAPSIAELEVLSVASSSAVCSIQKKTADIQPGDLAFMDQATAELLAQKRELSATRKFPQVVSFNQGDPLEEEARDVVPRPPLPEVNRIRGRFGFDYSNIQSTGSVLANNSQIGLVVRTDFSRIGGSYWNLSGYWRGRINNSSNAEQPTLQDLINRTYHLNLSYSNPTSAWVAGFGRLYLPWATSLDTIDGGYFGRKAGKHLLLGMFAGSTPDPTSWDYNPDRRIGGVFLNLEGGSFDSLRVSSTSGVALSTLKWQVDRPFIFFENGLYFKRYFSIYDSTQADDPRPVAGLNAAGPGLSRNFFSMRFQPFERLSFDVDHNYFRDVPTFDTVLIATGLLDKYLFQGLSTGARVEPIRHITFYASVGKSSRTGDTSGSWNQMYGVTLAQLPKTGLRIDVRTSQFDSSFGSGKYRSLSISRNFTEALHLEAQVGQQFLNSQLSSQTESRFVNATLDGNLGKNYFVQGAYTVERGGTFNYDQWTVTMGYRFDNRIPGAGK